MTNIDLSMNFSRLFIQVSDENRFKRRQALESIFKELNECDYGTENNILICSKVVHQIFDTNEKNREITHDILKNIIEKESDIENLLPIIIPEFFNKLGDRDNIEVSEEIRYGLMNILSLLVEKAGKTISIFIEEISRICCLTLSDNYSEVKRISCLIIDNMSKVKDQNFHNNSEQLVAPLIANLCHQHSKVRLDCVMSLGRVLLCGSVKSFDTVCSNLAQRLFDENNNVRRGVIKVFGSWLLDLADRYSFHSKLIPVFLSGFIDETEEIRELCSDLWHDIGVKYLHENETDLKDDIDFEDVSPSNYPIGYERPNLGCRILLFRTMSRILPALTRDLSDWSENTRLKAAQLLGYLIINGEGACTQHCQLLLGSTLIRGLVDNVVEVRQACRESSKLLGYFVEPKIWWHVLRRIINQSDADESFLAGEILLLSCIIESSDPVKLFDDDVIGEICDYLKSSDISCSCSTKIKSAGLRCILSIVTKFSESFSQVYDLIGYRLFYTALSFASYECQNPDDEVRSAFDEQLNLIVNKFSESISMVNTEQLYEKYTGELLTEMHSRANLFSALSTERLLCCKLLLSAGPVIGLFVEPILDILEITLNKEKEIELRLKFFITLVKLTSNMDITFNSKGLFQSEHLERLLNVAILPNLMWQAGRTAEALRRVAITCLWSILVGCCQCTDDSRVNPFSRLSSPLWQDLLVRELASLDDDLQDTRMTSCRSLVISLDIISHHRLVERQIVDRDQLHRMYPSFVKRMDDANDDIRIYTTKVLVSWINVLREKFDASLYRAHLEDLMSGMLVHLDDSNRQVQLAVYDVLVCLGQISPEICVDEVTKVRNKHRSTKFCDDLITELQAFVR